MRRGVALLAICGGVVALFVSAAHTPSRRIVILYVSSGSPSCKTPPAPLTLAECVELRMEARKELKALRASTLPPLPGNP